jgi:hypothetical protein
LLTQVVKKSIGLFMIDPDSGLVTLEPASEHDFLSRKQRAVLLNNWLLAYYPSSIKYKAQVSKRALDYQPYLTPSYAVLVNLKTGQWTTDLHSPFALSSPLKKLSQQLRLFYSREMDAYE